MISCWGHGAPAGSRAANACLLLPAWSLVSQRAAVQRQHSSAAADHEPYRAPQDGAPPTAFVSEPEQGGAGQQQQHDHQQQQQQQQQQQCRLTVAIVGLPNAGKSTLANRLIGTKISGVSSKRNTTISPQLGSFSVGNTQVLLYDTPGLVEESVQGNPLDRLRSAWTTAAMADQMLFIVDAERQFRFREPSLLKLAQQLAEGPPALLLGAWRRPPSLLFLNKQDKLSDLTRATVLQQLRRQLCGIVDFEAVFEGAAMLGEGVPQLRDFLVQQARPGRWLLPAGQAHAATPGELAVELVREKLYRRLNQELPYRLAVGLQSVTPARNGSGGGLHIRVNVTVKNRMVKSIVVGRRGKVIQGYVAAPTQAELSRTLGVPVTLAVTVKSLHD